MWFPSNKIIIGGAVAILVIAIAIIGFVVKKDKDEEEKTTYRIFHKIPDIEYKFIPKTHSPGGTILRRPDLKGNLIRLLDVARRLQPKCIAFDTMGNFKDRLPELYNMKNWGDDPNHGIYIRKDIYNELLKRQRISGI